MSSNPSRTVAIVISLVFILRLCMHGQQVLAQVPQFQDGDTVVFLGDSITHSRKWHSYIADYYLTHLPERHIRYVNAGISGDTAAGALKRMDRDVFAYHPSVVVVMLGMNDVRGQLYAEGRKITPELLKERQKSLDDYNDNVRTIVSRLHNAKVRDIILAISSPYDDTSKSKLPNQPGVNEALRKVGVLLTAIAQDYSTYLIDFNAPMTKLQLDIQVNDSSFSLNPVDRVHPAEPGNLVMAYLFLKAQAVPFTSETRIDILSHQTDCSRCNISDIHYGNHDISFTLSERALPMAVDPAALEALHWLPIADTLNRESLTLNLVPKGIYNLRIDKYNIGTFNSDELARGIDLSANQRTPQYRQAMHVEQLNESYRQLAVSLRDLEKVRDDILAPAKRATNSPATEKDFLTAWLVRKVKNDPSQSQYYSDLVAHSLATEPHETEIKQQMEKLCAEMEAADVPQPHRYHFTVASP